MTIQQTCEYLKAQNQILILCHQSPDGDTLGSGFGLYYALRAMGKQVRVACSDPIPPQFSFCSHSRCRISHRNVLRQWTLQTRSC